MFQLGEGLVTQNLSCLGNIGETIANISNPESLSDLRLDLRFAIACANFAAISSIVELRPLPTLNTSPSASGMESANHRLEQDP